MNGHSSLSSDIITTLPQSITENILTLMPIRDALRTSILSSKWRYSWTTIPKLVFDYKLFEVGSYNQDLKRQKFLDAIFHVLLLHKGPILEFYLSVDKVKLISKFDQIILHLSRRNDLKTLNIEISRCFYKYKLPTSFFSLQGLEDLQLTNCDFKPPLTFNGLSRLRHVFFINVEARPKMVQTFLSNCPRLEKVSLAVNVREYSLMKNDEYVDDMAGRNTSTFVEFLPYVPSFQCLDLTKYYMKYMAASGMPHKLPTSLVHLKILYLDVCLMEQHEISSLLCIIRSSPNLEDILFQMYDNKKLPVRQTSVDVLDPQNYLDLRLDRLEKLEIQMFSNLAIEMEFVKLIMAKSPVLKKVRIELNNNISVDEELKILRDFISLQFSCGSPSARLIIERPKPSSGKLSFGRR